MVSTGLTCLRFSRHERCLSGGKSSVEVRTGWSLFEIVVLDGRMGFRMFEYFVEAKLQRPLASLLLSLSTAI